MKIQIVKIFSIAILVSSYFFAQEVDTLNNNCPPLFTHIKTINPEINILSVEVIDSSIYDSLPKFIENLQTISNKIIYPEIEKRAGVDGKVILLIRIDSLGQVIEGNILKGISGATIEEATLEKIKNEKFYPAMKNNNGIASQLIVTISFKLNSQIDKPDIFIDEIKYEFQAGHQHLINTLIFNREGSAYYSEDNGSETTKKYVSKILLNDYTKLNDFIISQCFQDYEPDYTKFAPKSTANSSKTIITIKASDFEKSVVSNIHYEPVGLWAIRNIIIRMKDSLKWEEVTE